MNLEQIKKIYDAATGNWTGADWTHENGSEFDENIGFDEPIYCEGGDAENCETCRDAEDAAERAEELAEEIMGLLRSGNVDTVRDMLADKQTPGCTESEFGDSPTWGAFDKVVQEFLDEAEARSNAANLLDDMADDDVIHASDAAKLFPGRPTLHTAMTVARAASLLGCGEEMKQLGWFD